MSQPQPSSATLLPSSSSSMASAVDLESIIADITTSTSSQLLLPSLLSFAKHDVGETILASFLPGGLDPLTVLDAHVNTLGYLFVLFVASLDSVKPRWLHHRSARLNIAGAPPVSFATISHFCRNFDAQVARLVPDRGLSFVHYHLFYG